jgi:Heterokaryon incompatibility protein (HET)
MVSFDLGEELECANWIRTGHTPLIVRSRDGTNGTVGWKLIRSHDVESGKTKKYVAMAHVWVDGTGNANGNALPSCQLEKFQKAAIQLYDASDMDEPVPFWVDTICVPFNKGPLKMLAIRRMEQVYQEADKVWVFDSGLQQVTLDTPASECLTQIEISSWNERLWTIQEAAFAKIPHFQFKDGLTSIQELLSRYRLDRFARMALIRYGMSSERQRPTRLTRLARPRVDAHIGVRPSSREIRLEEGTNQSSEPAGRWDQKRGPCETCCE